MAETTVEIEPAASDDARRCLNEYYDELGRRFDPGFLPRLLKAYDAADMSPPKGWFVIARIGKEAVGCGALLRLDAATGEIKRVWVSPAHRGAGVATRVMDRLEGLAAQAGFRCVRLDTNGALTEARAMYAKRGYREIVRYNDNPAAQYWFEKDIGAA